MSVSELETTIIGLSKEERFELVKWLQEYMADEWDRQFEEDVKAGRLDPFGKKSDAAFENGECTPL